MRHWRCQATGVAALALLSGCINLPYDAARATEPFPRQLSVADPPVDIEVIRQGERLRLVNATTTSYRDFRLWLNQRYMTRVDELAPGASVIVPINRFWDVWGGSPNPGGIFRRFEPTPIRIAQIQVDDESPLVGLVVIRAERAE